MWAVLLDLLSAVFTRRRRPRAIESVASPTQPRASVVRWPFSGTDRFCGLAMRRPCNCDRCTEHRPPWAAGAMLIRASSEAPIGLVVWLDPESFVIAATATERELELASSSSSSSSGTLH